MAIQWRKHVVCYLTTHSKKNGIFESMKIDMKYFILLILLYIPLANSADYRKEIMDNMINPCFRETMKNAGLNPDNPKLLDSYIKQYGQEIMGHVDLLQRTLEQGQPSYSERQELYRIGLNSCLDGMR